MAICRAVGTYDSARGHPEHYAVFCARRHMLNRKRWHKSRSREIAVGSFSDHEVDGELSEVALEAREQLDAKAAICRLSDAVDTSLVWEVAVLMLTSRELNVIRLIYIGASLPSEAAAEIGISPPPVTQIVKSALANCGARSLLLSPTTAYTLNTGEYD